MSTFTDEQQVYARLGRAFQELVADTEKVAPLKRADLIVQYQFRKPESTITVKLLANEDAGVQFGPTTWPTQVVYAMDADVAHSFFLGEINPSVALARGDIRASGPVKKILEVVPTLGPVMPLYREYSDAPLPEPAAEVEDGPVDSEAVAPDEAPASEEVTATQAPDAEAPAEEAAAAEAEETPAPEAEEPQA